MLGRLTSIQMLGFGPLKCESLGYVPIAWLGVHGASDFLSTLIHEKDLEDS